ncbi:MAG: hypothetical protein AAB625_03170 [Patescibacteria group bacterium]
MNPIKKTIKAIGEEPLEFLKSVAKQINVSENTKPLEQPINQEQSNLDKTAIAEKDGRHLQALESELKDIRRQKIFNDLMRRIQAGENIPLEEFTELSYEQRDVLKAQIEAVKTRNSQLVTDQLVMPSAKKGRKMGGGQKQSAQQQTTRVEKPVPPSG